LPHPVCIYVCVLLVAGERSRGRGSSAARADAPASAASGLRRPRASETAPAASFVADARPLGRRRRTSQVSVSQTDPRDAPSHRSTQPCIPPGSLNRVPASAGVKGGNITSVGWQVTLCDPIWHVSSRSGAATLRTAIHLLLTYLPPPPLVCALTTSAHAELVILPVMANESAPKIIINDTGNLFFKLQSAFW